MTGLAVSDRILAARFDALGVAEYRLEFRLEDGKNGIGVNGDQAWVPFRRTARATLLDLAALLEHKPR